MSITFRTFTSQVSTVLGRAGKFMSAVVESIAEARIQRTLIETQLYRNRYRHRSKIDDDLPLAH